MGLEITKEQHEKLIDRQLNRELLANIKSVVVKMADDQITKSLDKNSTLLSEMNSFIRQLNFEVKSPTVNLNQEEVIASLKALQDILALNLLEVKKALAPRPTKWEFTIERDEQENISNVTAKAIK